MLPIRSLKPFLCLTVILITFNLKCQSKREWKCAGDKQIPMYVFFLENYYKLRSQILFLKDDIDCYVIPEMERRAVHIFA